MSASSPEPWEVWPTRVVDSQIAHLARPVVDDTGATYRAICPGADGIRELELVPDVAVVIWCPSCRAWAEEVGIPLPRGR